MARRNHKGQYLYLLELLSLKRESLYSLRLAPYGILGTLEQLKGEGD